MTEDPSIHERYRKLKDSAAARVEALYHQPVIRVGTATCGIAAGALPLKEALTRVIQEKKIEARVIDVGCMGHCYAEPLAIISKPGFPALCYGYLDDELAARLVEDFLMHDDPCYEFALVALETNDVFPTFSDFPRGVYEKKIVLEHCGFIDPEDIDHYIARGGYGALAEMLAEEPAKVLEMVKESHLRGRGGAGFPAGLKWEAALKTGGHEKYVICNADEGDPGAFMDRSILESCPHQVIEGMLLCAYAIGAE
ncbi:MAG: NADH-quinone oxidoreductase subunit F, partial [Dethiobacteria bacterium]